MSPYEWGLVYRRILTDAGVTGPVVDLADQLDQVSGMLAEAAHVNKSAVGFAMRDALAGQVFGLYRFGIQVPRRLDAGVFTTPAAKMMERVRLIASQAEAILNKVVDH